MPMPDADDMPATPFSAAGTATRVIMTLTDAGGNVIDKKDTVYEGDAETIAQEIMRGKSLNSRIKEER